MAVLRILLVADPADRVALRAALETSDLTASLTEASDRDAGLAQLAAHSFECIVVGDAPAGTTGVELIAAARAAGNRTPIVMASHHTDEAHLQAALEAGANDYTWMEEISARRLAMRIRFAIRTTRNAQTRDEILAIVSHDLRGPLHAIGLATEALRGCVDADGGRYIGAIERASNRAERLIADLLEASAIENGALALEIRPIDAAAVVRQAAVDHELLAKEANGSITTIIPPESLFVTADRDRILQVLQNLIGNALKHAKGTPIEIALARGGDGNATFSVRDGGPGIAPPELPHVFDRYWRGRTKRTGAGLGLAIAKGIVDAHGGSITAASRDRGAEFAFTLPLAR